MVQQVQQHRVLQQLLNSLCCSVSSACCHWESITKLSPGALHTTCITGLLPCHCHACQSWQTFKISGQERAIVLSRKKGVNCQEGRGEVGLKLELSTGAHIHFWVREV